MHNGIIDVGTSVVLEELGSEEIPKIAMEMDWHKNLA
jgi:hypothetical protein